MPKILLVANTDWYLYRFRLPLARFLRDKGFHVAFASPPGPFVEKLTIEGFFWHRWDVGRQGVNPFMELASVWSLMKIFRAANPDLAHLHTIKSVLYGSLAAWMARGPKIVSSITGRGYVFLGTDLKARLIRPIIHLLYRFVLHSITSITVFENRTDRQFFIDSGLVDDEDTCLIEGVGVDIDYYQPLPEPNGVPTALMASRMLWDKGVGTLAEAAGLLKKREVGRIVLVGEPDEGNPANIPAETLRAWVTDDLLEWWGWKSDMLEVFSACHVVLLPSFSEGIPTVLLEAGACGRPIVATDVPGCRDVVKNNLNGLLVPAKDAVALAAAIETLLTDSALRGRMGKAGRELVEKRFSDRHIYAQTLSVYNDVLGLSSTH